MFRKSILTFLSFGFIATANAHESGIDERSYNLGILGGFSEVVRLGVKNWRCPK